MKQRYLYVASVLAVTFGFFSHAQTVQENTLRKEYEELKKKKSFDGMQAVAERIGTLPGIDVYKKINAAELAAAALLEGGNVNGGEERILKTLQLPGLTTAEKLYAYDKILRFYDNAFLYEKSLAFASKLKTEAKLESRLTAIRSDSLVRQRKFEEALALNRASGDKAGEANVLHAAERYPEAILKAMEVLRDSGQPETVRWNAFCRALESCHQELDFKTADLLVTQYLPQFTQKNAARNGQVYPILRTAMRKGACSFAANAAGAALYNPAFNPKDYFLVRLYRLNALAALGKRDELIREAKLYSGDKRLTDAQRYQTALTAAAFAKDFDKDAAEVDNAFAKKQISNKERSESVIKAGRTAMLGGNYEAAKKLHAKYEALFFPEAQKTAAVEFFRDGAPAGISAWENIPFLAWRYRLGKLDRKFGGNLEFLATDVSTGDRGAVGSGGGGNDRDTDFYAACDEKGVHFFFDGFDERAEDAAAGLTGAGSYEGYLAPGENQPYYCFLINLQDGKATLWNSAYNNDFHRMGKIGENVSSEFRYSKTGHKTYLFFDWELFYDKLPANGESWSFDNIRWGRSGGYSWNGIKTVHGRSSLGNLKFELTEDDLAGIQRRLLLKARVRYEKEKTSRGHYAGIIDYWKDDAVGDPEFYRKVVAPLEKELDAYAAEIKPSMSDETVRRIYGKAMKPMMNLKLYLENLRRDYLNDKSFES